MADSFLSQLAQSALGHDASLIYGESSKRKARNSFTAPFPPTFPDKMTVLKPILCEGGCVSGRKYKNEKHWHCPFDPNRFVTIEEINEKKKKEAEAYFNKSLDMWRKQLRRKEEVSSSSSSDEEEEIEEHNPDSSAHLILDPKALRRLTATALVETDEGVLVNQAIPSRFFYEQPEERGGPTRQISSQGGSQQAKSKAMTRRTSSIQNMLSYSSGVYKTDLAKRAKAKRREQKKGSETESSAIVGGGHERSLPQLPIPEDEVDGEELLVMALVDDIIDYAVWTASEKLEDIQNEFYSIDEEDEIAAKSRRRDEEQIRKVNQESKSEILARRRKRWNDERKKARRAREKMPGTPTMLKRHNNGKDWKPFGTVADPQDVASIEEKYKTKGNEAVRVKRIGKFWNEAVMLKPENEDEPKMDDAAKAHLEAGWGFSETPSGFEEEDPSQSSAKDPSGKENDVFCGGKALDAWDLSKSKKNHRKLHEFQSVRPESSKIIVHNTVSGRLGPELLQRKIRLPKSVPHFHGLQHWTYYSHGSRSAPIVKEAVLPAPPNTARSATARRPHRKLAPRPHDGAQTARGSMKPSLETEEDIGRPQTSHIMGKRYERLSGVSDIESRPGTTRSSTQEGPSLPHSDGDRTDDTGHDRAPMPAIPSSNRKRRTSSMSSSRFRPLTRGSSISSQNDAKQTLLGASYDRVAVESHKRALLGNNYSSFVKKHAAKQQKKKTTRHGGKDLALSWAFDVDSNTWTKVPAMCVCTCKPAPFKEREKILQHLHTDHRPRVLERDNKYLSLLYI